MWHYCFLRYYLTTYLERQLPSYHCLSTLPTPSRPSVSAVALARRAQERPNKGIARVPFNGLHCLAPARALPLAVRGHRAHPHRCRPGCPLPRPTLGKGSGRASPPPCPVQPAAFALNSAPATCTFDLHGLTPQDGAVTFSEKLRDDAPAQQSR